MDNLVHQAKSQDRVSYSGFWLGGLIENRPSTISNNSYKSLVIKVKAMS